MQNIFIYYHDMIIVELAEQASNNHLDCHPIVTETELL